MLDRRAVKILTNTFWSPTGWRRDRYTSPEDFAYAKACGIMFDPRVLSHDLSITWAISARDRITQERVVSAFIVSLLSRRLDLRSGLGSYAAVRHLHAHDFASHGAPCAVCGGYDTRGPEDLNVLSFERIRWGGVRHWQPVYAGFDLTQLARADFEPPTADDYDQLGKILDVARSLPPKARLGDLDKALKTVIPSNSAERRTLIGILGYCGILQNPDKPGFRKGYVPFHQRQQTPWHTDDWPYPVQWWTASCGISEEAVADWFGDHPAILGTSRK